MLRSSKENRRLFTLSALLILAIAVGNVLLFLPASAADDGRVQELTGAVFPGELYYYRLDDLQGEDTLYIYLDETSGNLDPVVAVIEGNQDIESLEREYQRAVADAVTEGADPLEAMAKIQQQLFLAVNDDGGEGLTAVLEYDVPQSGDYGLVVAGSMGSFGFETAGDYRLLLGINEPDVLGGEAQSTGDVIGVLDRDATPQGERIEEIQGTITEERSEVFYKLTEARIGDRLQIYVEAVSGDLKPSLTLYNYADKPVVVTNANGSDSVATLEYTFDEAGRGYRLGITGCCDDTPSSGDYRLVIGTNAPEVLTGQAVATGESLVEKPTEVQIGVKLQQMIDVNESSEYYNAVVSMQMEWMDPDAAFSPDTCDCMYKTYTAGDFSEFLAAVGNWPEFTIFNQQGQRWSQNKVGVIRSDGHVLYFERFTTNLQVDFDFSRYPFDIQEFTIKVDNVYPKELFVFTDLPGYTEIAEDHGEDEFIITDWQTEQSTVQASTKNKVSRFTFSFTSPRHLDYYVLQIFMPILLIIVVSYVTFFLRDYGRRIEVASANLLLFIAFSFSLADNYPRLGYVTLLDALMSLIFVINALVVIYNVWLRKMEMAGDAAKSERIDSVLDWAYPLLYLVAMFGLYLWFFVIH